MQCTSPNLHRVGDQNHPEVDHDHAGREAKASPTIHSQCAVAAFAGLVEEYGACHHRCDDHEQGIEDEEIEAIHGEENHHGANGQANQEMKGGTENGVHDEPRKINFVQGFQKPVWLMKEYVTQEMQPDGSTVVVYVFEVCRPQQQ